MPKEDTTKAVQSKDKAALARKKARQEARAAVTNLPPIPRGGKAWDEARTSELFRLYKEQGDMSARDELIASQLNLVRSIAWKYKDRGQNVDDLVQVGTIGLIKAIDGYDPSMGNKFATFATPTITGEIRRYFRDKGWDIRVPRSLQELSKKVTDAADELRRTNQRTPTTEEIATYLNRSVDDILEAMESSMAYSVKSLDAPKYQEDQGGSDDDAPAVIDQYISKNAGGDRVEDTRTFEETTSEENSFIEDAISDLSPREQEVVRMRFYDELTQVEIAEKLGISQVQVSRLLHRTLQKVRAKLSAEGMMGL